MVVQSIEHLSPQDRDLITGAVAYLKNTFIPDKRFVAATLQTSTGKIFYGFNIHTTLTKAAICAEAIVLGEALRHGETNFTTLVCVASNRSEFASPRIVSSCGMCRELLRDYAPQCTVIVANENDTITKLSVATLLPARYQSIPL